MTATDTRLTRRPSKTLLWFRSYGVFALAMFLMGTSKWGSYLPFARPPYISDIVVGILLAHRILFGPLHVGRRIASDGTVLRPLIVALLALIILEFVRGSYSVTAIRDFAPYFYAVVVFLMREQSPRARDTMRRVIDIVIIFHAAWISLGVLAPSVYQNMPSFAGRINLLSPRNDFDGAVCAIFAAYALHRALSGRSIPLNIGLAVWNVVVLLALKERAGLLSLALVLVVVALLTRERARLTRAARAKALLPILLLCLPLIAVASSNTYAYQRLLSAVHSYVPIVHSQPQFAGDTGTQHARSNAWKRIVGWLGESSSRDALGVGFGPDFMHASGADILLLGGVNADVRSPHNYYVGTWARLGIVGVCIVSLITLLGLWLAVLVKRLAKPLCDVDVLAIMVVVGLPIAAAVGVILESPFGAIPWFWALGHLSVRCSELRWQSEEPSPSRRNAGFATAAGAGS